MERLEPGYVITANDVEQALAIENLRLEAGDAVFFHTGWSTLWNDHEKYLAGEPGPGLELAHHLVEKGIVLTGCDTWSYGPVPPENPKQPFIVPQTLNVEYGVFVVENLDTSALVHCKRSPDTLCCRNITTENGTKSCEATEDTEKDLTKALRSKTFRFSINDQVFVDLPL